MRPGQSYFRTAYSTGEVLSRTFVNRLSPKLEHWTNYSIIIVILAPGKTVYRMILKSWLPIRYLIAPGSGGEGLCSLKGYQLQPNSPCINTGVYVPLSGEHDFWGNPLDDGHTDFGAYEQIGSGVFADKVKLEGADRKYTKESTMAWAKWSFPLQIQVEEEGNIINIRLLDPLDENVKGTITWIDPEGKKVVQVLDKQKKRDEFTLKVKADKATLLASSVQVDLQYGDLEETWNIPFTEGRRR